MRIKDKIEEIEAYLSELQTIAPKNFQVYVHDPKTKAACERYFEKIVEAVVDLVFLIIKDKNLKIPEDDKEAFDILAENNIISKELSTKMRAAKGMRNIIAHEYGKIDNKIVFDSIVKELQKDAREFLDEIKVVFK